MYHTDCNFGFIHSDGFSHTPIHMNECGIELQKKESYRFDNATRPHPRGFLFQYTFEGCGAIRIGKSSSSSQASSEHLLPAGTGFFVPIPSDTCYYLPTPHGSKNSFWHLGYLVFDGMLGHILYEKIEHPVFSLSPRSLPIQRFLAECHALRNGKKYRRYENSEFIYRFVLDLIRELEAPHRLATPCVEASLQWLNDNYTSPYNISDMCEAIGVSLSHLSRQFQVANGVAPSEYLTRLRLEHALSLLHDPTLSIQDIAIASGFSCSNYFTKVFRKSMSMTPSEYRRLHLSL